MKRMTKVITIFAVTVSMTLRTEAPPILPISGVTHQKNDLLQQLMRALESNGSIIFIQNTLQHGSQGDSSPKSDVLSSVPHLPTRSTPSISHPIPVPDKHKDNTPTVPHELTQTSSFSLPVNSTAKLGIGASCITALVAWVKIKLLARSVLRNGWASWHSDIPCEVLMQLSDKDIVAELWPSLRDHYSDDDEPITAFKIMQLFLNDLENERTELEKLLWWHHILNTIGLGNLLHDTPIATKARQRCQRLDLLEDCVRDWINQCLCKDGTVNEYTPLS